MIVKMIILRLLDSSDDKEKEKIGVARPEGPPIRGIGASGGSRKNRRHDVWCRMESKPSQPLGTG